MKTCKFISLDDAVLCKPSFRANEDLILLSLAHRNEQTPASATITPFVCNIKTTLALIAAQEEDKTPQESRRETEQEESFEIKSQVSDLTDDTDREEVTSTANLKATKRKHIDTTTSIAHGGDSKEMTFAKLLRYTQKGAELH